MPPAVPRAPAVPAPRTPHPVPRLPRPCPQGIGQPCMGMLLSVMPRHETWLAAGPLSVRPARPRSAAGPGAPGSVPWPSGTTVSSMGTAGCPHPGRARPTARTPDPAHPCATRTLSPSTTCPRAQPCVSHIAGPSTPVRRVDPCTRDMLAPSGRSPGVPACIVRMDRTSSTPCRGCVPPPGASPHPWSPARG